MKFSSTMLTALAVTAMLDTALANAQTTSPPGTSATRPATTPSGQTSIPTDAPPAATTQTTGEVSQDPVVKKMNEDEKKKVETKGK
jgi:hypothetical protein